MRYSRWAEVICWLLAPAAVYGLYALVAGLPMHTKPDNLTACGRVLAAAQGCNAQLNECQAELAQRK